MKDQSQKFLPGTYVYLSMGKNNNRRRHRQYATPNGCLICLARRQQAQHTRQGTPLNNGGRQTINLSPTILYPLIKSSAWFGYAQQVRQTYEPNTSTHYGETGFIRHEGAPKHRPTYHRASHRPLQSHSGSHTHVSVWYDKQKGIQRHPDESLGHTLHPPPPALPPKAAPSPPASTIPVLPKAAATSATRYDLKSCSASFFVLSRGRWLELWQTFW